MLITFRLEFYARYYYSNLSQTREEFELVTTTFNYQPSFTSQALNQVSWPTHKKNYHKLFRVKYLPHTQLTFIW